MITLSNKRLEVTLDESLGGEIRSVEFDGDPILAFYDWAAPISVARSRTFGDATLDWLSDYRGGWQLLVPNAGAACVVNGVPLPFHGEWSRTQVDVVLQTATDVMVRAGTRLPIVVQRRVQIFDDPPRIAVTTAVENVSEVPVSFVWGEHPAFLVSPGDRIDLPPGLVVDAADIANHSAIWPDSPTGRGRLDVIPSTSPLESVHYLPHRCAGWAALRRPHVGVAITWNLHDFPHMWLWHEIASPGFPFYGRTSMLALEPASSWPGDGLAEAIARGQAHRLDCGERRATSMTLVPFRPDERAVVGVDNLGTIYFDEEPV